MTNWDMIMNKLFYVDGSLRDIYILNTTIADWRNFLKFLELGEWLIELSRDNDTYRKIPYTAEQIFKFRAFGDNVQLSINVNSAKVNCYFFDEDQIELDIDPKEVESLELGQQIISFVNKLSLALKRECILTPENSPEDPLVVFKPQEDRVIISYVGDSCWFCPAIEKFIPHGLCWEYYFADRGGPMDTAKELKRWIIQSKKFDNIDNFHERCERCSHKQG